MDTALASWRQPEPSWPPLQADDVYLPLPDHLSAIRIHSRSLITSILLVLDTPAPGFNGCKRCIDGFRPDLRLISHTTGD
jgi:hypothetical protein